MKKVLLIVAIFLGTIMSLAAVVGITRKNKEAETETPMFTITYKAIEEGEVVDVRSYLYDESGSYPTELAEGEALYVDDLLGKEEAWEWYLEENELPVVLFGACPVTDPDNPNKDYTFVEWYIDEACEFKFVQGMKMTRDLTLYAKINVGYWIGKYY